MRDVRTVETSCSIAVLTYGPDSKRTMLAIKIPRFSISKAPISRMIKPAVMRRAPQGMSSVILHDLYLLHLMLVTARCESPSSRLTMSARHERRQKRSKLPQRLVVQSCWVDSTRHCRELRHKSQPHGEENGCSSLC